ncbi:saccharopine dehydrogenase family protein [Emcibacter nanhaiensis]|uniref:Saccharopine dehydrogenase NADP binding domain-containing protein n=1 Tax=Emcibacter nanhaiensis TaxID=1505037 RepID=A0A501PGQ7_9PROT|nr:saccharopine dehydrogenase NADP-binding domain-containing protein [Emcibacter nanhaiensis]TPD59257.1 hypothetical protein FIV46_10695 [Emcibacter nanhaiensis]
MKQVTQPKRILVVGAGGSMTQTFLKGVAAQLPDNLSLNLRDINEAAAQQAATLFPDGVATAGELDLFDREALQSAIAEADFVVNGAGPFHLTAGVVRRAAIKAGISYLDLDDDTESTLDGICLSEEAKANNSALYLGCGASPGLTNVLAQDLAEHLDRVEEIDVVWCVGDEGPQLLGRSVVAHTLHMGAGTYAGWRNGQQTERQSYASSRRFSLPGLKKQSFYECAHPEPVMLGHSYPDVRSVTCWGSLHPAPINGIIKGVALAEKSGRVSTEDAITFLQNAIAGQKTDKSVEQEAKKGITQQLSAGEISLWDVAEFLFRDLLKLQYPTKAATAAIVRGEYKGDIFELIRYVDSSPAGSPLKFMDVSTGYSQAAFFLEAIKNDPGTKAGCLFPEQWINPGVFYERLSQLLGIPVNSWLSPVRFRPFSENGAGHWTEWPEAPRAPSTQDIGRLS